MPLSTFIDQSKRVSVTVAVREGLEGDTYGPLKAARLANVYGGDKSAIRENATLEDLVTAADRMEAELPDAPETEAIGRSAAAAATLALAIRRQEAQPLQLAGAANEAARRLLAKYSQDFWLAKKAEEPSPRAAAVAAPGESITVRDAETRAGAQFLHKYDRPDKKGVDVTVRYLRQHGAKIRDNGRDRTDAYLQFMADPGYVDDGILTGNPDSIARQINPRIIRAEDVPESYFALQRRIARNQGQGDLEITPAARSQFIEAIQADQRGSLEQWAEYVSGTDANYPDWFKQYTWSSIMHLGSFDKETGKFGRREVDTVAPYPEINREALAYVYDMVKKAHVIGEQIDDTQLTRLLKDGSFGQLYAHAIQEATPDSLESRQEIAGSWAQFNQSDDPHTAQRLAGSLQGHGTGWCTAGESKAAEQLRDGDFYVYYSRSEDGKDTIPRIAVRMDHGQVAEVRGVLPSQELEPRLVDIALEKIRGLPGGEAYFRKAEDMRRLTALDELLASNSQMELSREDLKFLYEIDGDIEGFGYQSDPRVYELKEKRGTRDYAELRILAVERLRERFDAAVAGYRAVADQLEHAPHVTDERLRQIFDAQMEDWQRRGVLEYVAESFMGKNKELHTPVIAPNVLASHQQLLALADKFLEGQPQVVHNASERISHSDRGVLYSQYTPEELSGRVVGGPVRVSLIPNKNAWDNGLFWSSGPAQRARLAEMQSERPNLSFHVPSVLDAVTYWYTLRAGGDSLTGNRLDEKTWIRHFDLEPKAVHNSEDQRPTSCIVSPGRPMLSWMGNTLNDARVAVR